MSQRNVAAAPVHTKMITSMFGLPSSPGKRKTIIKQQQQKTSKKKKEIRSSFHDLINCHIILRFVQNHNQRIWKGICYTFAHIEPVFGTFDHLCFVEMVLKEVVEKQFGLHFRFAFVLVIHIYTVLLVLSLTLWAADSI